MLRKEIEEDLHKWRDILYSGVGSLNIVRMSILPTSVYRFNALSLTFAYMTYSCTFLRTKFKTSLGSVPLGPGSQIPWSSFSDNYLLFCLIISFPYQIVWFMRTRMLFYLCPQNPSGNCLANEQMSG